MRHPLFSLFILLILVCVPPVTAQVEPGITGLVLDGPEQPLAGARVELVPVPSLYDSGRLRIETGQSPEPSAVAASDEGGRFRLSVPGASAWKVVVRAQGRVPVQFGPILWVEPGLALPPVAPPKDAGTVATVTGADGKPVQGAWVAATDADELADARRPGEHWRLEPRIALTGPSGAAVLPRLDGRPLDLRVLPPEGPLELHRNVTGGTVRLSGQGWSGIVLRVGTPAGEPLAGVQARLGDVNWPVGLTDAQGALLVPFSGSQPMRLRLLTADGRQKVVRLPPPSGSLLEVVVLDEPRMMTGRVLDAVSGRGLAGALLSREDDPGAVVRTDKDGRYRLVHSGPGDLHLQLQAAGYLPKRLTLSATDVRAGRIPSVSLERATPVAGIVLDAQRRPLAGAEIEAVPAALLGPRLLSRPQPVVDRAETDAAGRFTLRRLQAGQTYEIRARRSGSLPTAQPLSVPRGGLGRKPVQFQLNPVRAVLGRVVDQEGQPLAGAVVSLRPATRLGFQAPDPRAEQPLREGDPWRALTDGQGKFQLASGPAEELDVQVTRTGFAPAWRRGVRATGGKGAVDLGTLILAPGARLAGQVVDARSRPVPGAEIFLLSAPPRGLDVDDSLAGRQPETSSDPQGRFEIRDLPSGVPHHLVARAEGHLPAVLSAVRPSQKPLVVRLERAASLRGRVVDEQGAPVAEAQVGLTWQEVLPEDPELRVGKPVLRQAVTDGEGRFELRGSPEGPVILDVTARGFVFLGGVEVRLPLRPDRELELVLTRGASLRGRITTTAGEPVAKARVSTESGAGWSDAEGLYRVDGVGEGRQEIHVDHPDYARLKRPVMIEPGENELDFVVEAGTEVAGRVVDETGGPVVAAEVVLTPTGRRERQQYRAVSAEDGRFSLQPVMTGEYRLEAEANGLGSGELRAPVRVAKEPVTGLEIVLRPGAVLSGSVLGLTPEELASVRIEARKVEGKSLPARVDAEGRYEIRGLEPGDWLVRATLWQGRRQAQARVPVAPDDRTLSRDLEFGRRASLAGRVLFNDDPLADAVLSVRGQRFTQERSVTTDFEGAFLLDDLEPDTYQLGVNHPGKLLVHNQWVEVEGDREVEIRLEDAKLAGRVQEAGSGKAISGAIVSLRPTSGPEFLFAVGSREDGSFHLVRVPPAHYRLTVSANGYEPLDQEVQVVAGEEREGLDLALSRAQGARLQVRRASGAVPEMVHLLAQSAEGRVVAETRQPDAEGWIDLSTLPAGQWSLRISGTGSAAVSRSLSTPGEPLLVTLPDAATLQVRVADLAAADLAATLSLTNAGGQPFWALAPGGQVRQSWPVVAGRAEVEGVPTGVWTLHVQAADGRVWSGTATSSGQGTQEVAVGASESPGESPAVRGQSSEAPAPAVIPRSFM